MRNVLGLPLAATVLALGACAGEEEAPVATAAPVEECEVYRGVYAEVTDARPVFYGGDFDPGYVAVTDTGAIGPGQPNAMQYVVMTDDGVRRSIVAREQYRVGDKLYIEADSCERASITVIQELG